MHPEIRCEEQSCHAFGLRQLQQTSSTTADSAKIQQLAAVYLHRLHGIIEEMSDIFNSLDKDPGEYCAELLLNLPECMRELQA